MLTLDLESQFLPVGQHTPENPPQDSLLRAGLVEHEAVDEEMDSIFPTMQG